jgi:preprotein translocase subunit YajC
MNALSVLAQESDGGGGGFVSLLVLLLIPFAMYFLLIRPQRKRMKAQVSMQRSLGVGDEVITASGIYGFITGEEEDRFWLEIDDDVQIRIAKAAIQGKIDTSDDTDVKPAGHSADEADAAGDSDEADDAS